MSYSGSNAHELTARLLAALTPQYDVIDMQAVIEIISALEKIHITKELLETTRLGKHVNLLRRRTKEPQLARRAKVLVKRWRDLVIPGSQPSTGAHSNRTSVDRQVKPLTSPALARHAASPAVSSPITTSRQGWGYDSDSNDVILVDDTEEPPVVPVPQPPPAQIKRVRSRSPSPDAKRSKKPKKKRGHSRAGSGAEGEGTWASRNGAPRARNGCRPVDAYTNLMHKLPLPNTKKVKTTRELLEEIQARGAPPAHPAPLCPSSPEILLVDSPPSVAEREASVSPLRNGSSRSPAPAPPPAAPSPAPPAPPAPPPVHYLQTCLADDTFPPCTCDEEVSDPSCPARGRSAPPTPLAVHRLHNGLVPGVNGTRAAPAPHPLPVRTAAHPLDPALFTSVVPLYRYLDYADDFCVKNLSRVELCPEVPPYEFAPARGRRENRPTTGNRWAPHSRERSSASTRHTHTHHHHHHYQPSCNKQNSLSSDPNCYANVEIV